MLFLMGVLALLLTTPNANADDKEKYKLFAEETRKEVWALKLPEFTNTAVPDKYKDESAVILAAHSRLEITKKYMERYSRKKRFPSDLSGERCRDIFSIILDSVL